jgi:RNA polymerase subunit RPABC4/transcription elongation factor Spt4
LACCDCNRIWVAFRNDGDPVCPECKTQRFTSLDFEDDEIAASFFYPFVVTRANPGLLEAWENPEGTQVCAKCRAVFPNLLDKCPRCTSSRHDGE